MTYEVKQLAQTSIGDELLDFDWAQANEAFIDNHLWSQNEYTAESRFYLLYEKANLYGIILTKGEEENPPKADVTEFQGPVHLDSCLEFFFSYEPENQTYVNLETNFNAVKHVGIGAGRHNRIKPGQKELEDLDLITIDSKKHLVKGISFAFDWGIGFKIPAKLLYNLWQEYGNASEILDQRFYSGQEIKANFYKCGDETEYEHYFAWNPVKTEKPDFHRPEYFGTLTFE